MIIGSDDRTTMDRIVSLHRTHYSRIYPRTKASDSTNPARLSWPDQVVNVGPGTAPTGPDRSDQDVSVPRGQPSLWISKRNKDRDVITRGSPAPPVIQIHRQPDQERSRVHNRPHNRHPHNCSQKTHVSHLRSLARTHSHTHPHSHTTTLSCTL